MTLLPFLVFSLALPAAHASMPAPVYTSMEDLAAMVSKGGDAEAKELLHLARDVLKIAQAQGRPGAAAGEALTDFLASTAQDGLRGLEAWEELPPKERARLLRERATYARRFQKTYVWPWFQFQLGEKAEAESALSAEYAKASDRVMQLKAAHFFMGNGPLSEAEFLLRGLKAVSPAEKLKGYESRMKELKVHVSNLPQMGVTT